MTTLTLVRHGQTDWNLARRIQGSTDIPLNDTGRQQARAAAAALREEVEGPAIVVSSDLSRARETAQIIAETLGLGTVQQFPELRERAYGEAEGVEIEQFLERFGAWDRDNVPGAETRPELRARGALAMRLITRQVRAASAPVATSVIAVSHGAMIREMIAHASGDTLPLPGERLDNGSRHTFLVEGHGHALRLLSYTPIAA